LACNILVKIAAQNLWRAKHELSSMEHDRMLVIHVSRVRGCLYGSELAQVPELTHFPKMNFTTHLHETFGVGWLVKTNTNFCGKVSLDLGMRTQTLFYLKAKPARVNVFIWKTTQPVYSRSRVTQSGNPVRRACSVLI
jgi:hypothetical protein